VYSKKGSHSSQASVHSGSSRPIVTDDKLFTNSERGDDKEQFCTFGLPISSEQYAEVLTKKDESGEGFYGIGPGAGGKNKVILVQRVHQKKESRLIGQIDQVEYDFAFDKTKIQEKYKKTLT